MMFGDCIVISATAVSKCFCHLTNGFIICSVATEPNLKEWTTRTKAYDRCHETVGLRHLKSIISCKIVPTYK